MAVSISIRVVGPLALLVAYICTATAQEPRVVRATETEKKIEAELGKETEIAMIDAPLSDVILYLKDRHGIEVYLDVDGLPSEPEKRKVTSEISGISLRSALNHILARVNLAWTVRDEAIVITVPENTENLLVYDVRGLQNDGNLDETLQAVFPDTKIVAYGTSLVVNARQSDHNGMLMLLRQLHTHEQKIEQNVAASDPAGRFPYFGGRTNRRGPSGGGRSNRGRNTDADPRTNPGNPFGNSAASNVATEPTPQPSPFE